MTKKKTTKKKTAPKAPRPLKRFLISVDPSLKDWLEEEAESNNISRDGFIRLLLGTARATWQEFNEETQAVLFEDTLTTAEKSAIRAANEAALNTPKAVVERGLGKGKRKR